MFGIGTGELLLIFVIALFVLGPERLPSLARDIGRAMAELRKASDELTHEFMKADQAAPAPSAPPPPPAPALEAPPAQTTAVESTAGEEQTEFDRKTQEEADRAREEGRLGAAGSSSEPPPEPERWG